MSTETTQYAPYLVADLREEATRTTDFSRIAALMVAAEVTQHAFDAERARQNGGTLADGRPAEFMLYRGTALLGPIVIDVHGNVTDSLHKQYGEDYFPRQAAHNAPTPVYRADFIERYVYPVHQSEATKRLVQKAIKDSREDWAYLFPVTLRRDPVRLRYNPQDVINILHGKALEEDAVRSAQSPKA